MKSFMSVPNLGLMMKSVACCAGCTLPPLTVSHARNSSHVVPGSCPGSTNGMRRTRYQDVRRHIWSSCSAAAAGLLLLLLLLACCCCWPAAVADAVVAAAALFPSNGVSTRSYTAPHVLTRDCSTSQGFICCRERLTDPYEALKDLVKPHEDIQSLIRPFRVS